MRFLLLALMYEWQIISVRIIFIVCFFFLIGCNEGPRYKHKKKPQPGLCISFDDYSVDEWFMLRDMFKKHYARVTFFITKPDTLTPNQIEKLKILQADGHEIGFHGAHHLLSEHYIKKHSLTKYLSYEIVAGLNAMNKLDFYPSSFAYPYSAKYWGTDNELLKYFYVLRSEVPFYKDDDITKLDKCFYSFKGNRLIYAVAIDRNGNLNEASVAQALQRVKNKNEVLILYGHEPETTFDTAFLQNILQQANAQGIPFFTVSELVK